MYHIYTVYLFAIKELVQIPSVERPFIKLNAVKDIYDYTFEDFDISIPFKVSHY